MDFTYTFLVRNITTKIIAILDFMIPEKRSNFLYFTVFRFLCFSPVNVLFIITVL